jgi:hypothetical protein
MQNNLQWNFSKNFRNARRDLGLTILAKLTLDGVIVHSLIAALQSPYVLHANEFSQFGGALIYHILLFIVMVIEALVILVTIVVLEDRLGLFPIMVQEFEDVQKTWRLTLILTSTTSTRQTMDKLQHRPWHRHRHLQSLPQSKNSRTNLQH